jgi:hypothetical protein
VRVLNTARYWVGFPITNSITSKQLALETIDANSNFEAAISTSKRSLMVIAASLWFKAERISSVPLRNTTTIVLCVINSYELYVISCSFSIPTCQCRQPVSSGALDGAVGPYVSGLGGNPLSSSLDRRPPRERLSANIALDLASLRACARRPHRHRRHRCGEASSMSS